MSGECDNCGENPFDCECYEIKKTMIVPRIERIWAMPNKWTFTILPIKELVLSYVRTPLIWADPFAGKHSPAMVKNDMNPEMDVEFHLDALEFLKQFHDDSFDGVLFDPPYSITQAQQCYKSFGKSQLQVSPSSMKYWKLVKDEMARIIKPTGRAICCGWSSQGLGKGRGFIMERILLVPHGGSKNDTIVTVEKRHKEM